MSFLPVVPKYWRGESQQESRPSVERERESLKSNLERKKLGDDEDRIPSIPSKTRLQNEREQ